MTEKLKEYFMKVSDGDEKFAEEMISSMTSYIKNEAPTTGSTIICFFGSDVARAAKKTNTDLSKYFLEGDLDHFEMEASVSNGEIEDIVYVDGFRKTPVSI